MPTIHDVAAYLIERHGPMSTMKLQKLAYYAQAWALVWLDRPLFSAQFEAWRNGPVARDLYRHHRGEFSVGSWAYEGADAGALLAEEAQIADLVIDSYGSMAAHQLSDLTHNEDPWLDARRGCAPGDNSEAPISERLMRQYYGSRVGK